MRALLSLPLVAGALVVGAAGCGNSSSSDPLDNALSYMPKSTPVVVAIDTNLTSDQAKKVGKLIDKFGPVGTQFKNGIKQGIRSGSNGVSFDTDIKPLLGNDLVVGIPNASSLRSNASTPTIEAITTKDAGKAKSVIAKGSTKVGSSHGADVYKDNSGGTFTAVEGDTIVGASTQPLLDAALARHDGGDHMTKDDFNKALGDLDKSAIVRVAGDLQSIIKASARAGQATKVPWVGALRQFGATASAQDNGVAIDFQVQTQGLKEADLPIASGASAPPVVKRPGEIGLGIRNPQQIYNFAISALQTVNPKQFGQFVAAKQQIGTKLGVDIDKDILGQLTGNASISIVPNANNKFAARADLKNPAAFKTALAKAAKGLPALAKQFGGGSVAVSAPKGGNGFYALADRKTRQRLIFGVVRNSFVVASDPARAGAIATQSASTVAGAQGSVVLDLDLRTLVNQQLQKRGLPPVLQAFTGSLGDLVGYLKADTNSLRGNFTLHVTG
jgi:hypothetical protein